ncbi:hypothetical protein XO12_05290 [Marinitoga sp. 1154]|nr:hypothetical protein [Marinitoga sp. 1154]
MKIGNFTLKKKDDIYYFTIPIFENYGNLFHIFTTRKTGYNDKELDLGVNTQTALNDVYMNYLKLCETFNIKQDSIILSDQVHKDNILIIDESFKSNNFLFKRKVKNADGLITNKKNLFLVTLYADCTPIYFFDPVKEVIALAHSGWKGTVKKIGEKTVLKMIKEFGCNPKDILVALGPSIGPESFEVKEDVKNFFEKIFNEKNFSFSNEIIKPGKNEKYLIDIWKTIEYTLINTGIRKEHILNSNIDTYKNTDLLFSYRKEKNTGRMAAIMAIIDN